MTARPDPGYEALADARRVQQLETAVDAARAYVVAKRELGESTTGREMADALLDADYAYHELLVSLGEPYGCDPGTCPSAPAEIVVELPEGDTDDYWRSEG